MEKFEMKKPQIPTFVGLFICGNNLTLYCLPANLKLKKMREDHNPEVAGSNPAPATMKTRL